VSHTGYLAPVDKMIRELENAEVWSRDLQTGNQEWPKKVQSHRRINYQN
jgi:hypothetical protein